MNTPQSNDVSSILELYRRPVIVLSGGQDSVTCLGVALEQNIQARSKLPGITNEDQVRCISFRYGQRHAVEIMCATALCADLGIQHVVVDISGVASLVISALTGPGEVGKPHELNVALPSSFVPGRNALFFTLAHAWALTLKATCVVAGVCQTDYSGYPDCRRLFIDHLETTLKLGYGPMPIITPLMWMTKAQTWQLAEDVGFLDTVKFGSHTCYNGDHKTRHEWGYGCGTCPACNLRAAGYIEFMHNRPR